MQLSSLVERRRPRLGNRRRRREIGGAEPAPGREADPGKFGGTPRAHDEGHVAPGFQKFAADRAGCDDENMYSVLLFRESRYEVEPAASG